MLSILNHGFPYKCIDLFIIYESLQDTKLGGNTALQNGSIQSLVKFDFLNYSKGKKIRF